MKEIKATLFTVCPIALTMRGVLHGFGMGYHRALFIISKPQDRGLRRAVVFLRDYSVICSSTRVFIRTLRFVARALQYLRRAEQFQYFPDTS